MSRYARTPINLPKGVVVTSENGQVKVKGPKGELKSPLQMGILVTVEAEKAHVTLDGSCTLTTAMQGLYRSLVNNMVVGVTTGYEKRLTMIGVGYRAAVQGDKLDLQIGTSHPVKVAIPSTIKVEVEKSTLIKISGINKHTVGQFAAAVRAHKPPEPYKGKGIRYEDEYVRKKEGKAAKGKTA